MNKVERYKEVFESHFKGVTGTFNGITCAELDKYSEELDDLWYSMTEQEQNQIEDWNSQCCKDYFS